MVDVGWRGLRNIAGWIAEMGDGRLAEWTATCWEQNGKVAPPGALALISLGFSRQVRLVHL